MIFCSKVFDENKFTDALHVAHIQGFLDRSCYIIILKFKVGEIKINCNLNKFISNLLTALNKILE